MPALRRAFLAGLILLAAAAARADSGAGFLVLAPDRGFLGNEEVRDAFLEYRKGFKASLAFIGQDEAALSLQEGILELQAKGAREIIALPLFLSEKHPWLQDARRILAEDQRKAFRKIPIRVAPALPGHYLIAEILADRLARLSRDPAREALLLVAQGADGPENAKEIENDLLETAKLLGGRFPFAWQGAAALTGWDPRGTGGSDARLREILEGLRKEGLKPVIVPFDLTTKLDSMMTLSSGLAPAAREFSAAFDGADLTPHPNVALWLAQESNRRLPVSEKELGVVFMPHGADLRWNRTLLEAIAPLQKRYLIEPAFSMADPALIERAVRKLEARGARAVTVLRVFSLKRSFEDSVECALGLRPCSGPSGAPAHGHEHMAHAAPAPGPIRSASVFYTTGGVEDSPLFASALFERAMDLSRDPKSETVFLLAHGAGSDEENRRWLEILQSLSSQIKELAERKGAHFRGVRFGTWREDWPDKREAAVKAIREEIKKASADGTAIVIPARTALGGPERELLAGLDYAYAGQSFAPNPKFAQWVEGEIRASISYFNSR